MVRAGQVGAEGFFHDDARPAAVRAGLLTPGPMERRLQRDHSSGSPYDKACLREIAPETVAEAAFMIMRRVAARRGSSAQPDGPILENRDPVRDTDPRLQAG